MKTILDFSDENPDVNWVQISQIPNLEGVVLKVSEGITIQDKMFGIRFREALTENIPVKGLYLFYHPSDDPNRQAENYINWRKSVTADNTIPAIVDLEWDENPKEWANVPESKRYSDLKTLIARLEAENFEVMIYTSHAFMTQYLPQADFLAIYKLKKLECSSNGVSETTFLPHISGDKNL